MMINPWSREKPAESDDVCPRCARSFTRTPQPSSPWRGRLGTLIVAIPVMAAVVLAAVPTYEVVPDPAAFAPAASVAVVTARRATLQAPSARAHAARRHDVVAVARTMPRTRVSGAAPTVIPISFARDAQAP
jgi:hypothetical protein